MRRWPPLILVTFAVLAIPSAFAATKTVDVTRAGFTPTKVTVDFGDTVTWTNKDPYPHNVTSTAGEFKSGDIAPDAKWQFQATRAGRFPYTCTLHPGMNGMLIVEP